MLEDETIALRVVKFQPAAEGLEADAFLNFRSEPSEVADLNDQEILVEPGGDIQYPGGQVLLEAMFDRVLDHGLEEEAGNGFSPGGGIGLDVNFQALAIAGLFDLEIGGHGVEFGGERGGHAMTLFEGVAEIVGKFVDHLQGHVGVGGDFGADAVERIKEKMGIELGTEELQFHALGFLRGFFCPLLFGLGLGPHAEAEKDEAPGQINEGRESDAKEPFLPLGPARGPPFRLLDDHEGNGGLHQACDEAEDDHPNSGAKPEGIAEIGSPVDQIDQAGNDEAQGLHQEGQPHCPAGILEKSKANGELGDSEDGPDGKVEFPKGKGRAG